MSVFYPKTILFSLRGIFRDDMDRKVSLSQRSMLDTFVVIAEPVGRKPGIVVLTVNGFPMFDVNLPADQFENCIVRESETEKCLLTKEGIALWRNSSDFTEQKMFASLFTLFSTSKQCSLKSGLIVTPDIKNNITIGVTVHLHMVILYPEHLIEAMSQYKKVLIRNTCLDALVVHRTAQFQVYLFIPSVDEYLMLTVAEFTQYTSSQDSVTDKHHISEERIAYMQRDDEETHQHRYQRFASLFTQSPLCYSNMIVSVPRKEGDKEEDDTSCASFERVSSTLMGSSSDDLRGERRQQKDRDDTAVEEDGLLRQDDESVHSAAATLDSSSSLYLTAPDSVSSASQQDIITSQTNSKLSSPAATTHESQSSSSPLSEGNSPIIELPPAVCKPTKLKSPVSRKRRAEADLL